MKFTIQQGKVATVRGARFGPGEEAQLARVASPGRLAVLERAGIIEFADGADAPEGSRAAARAKLKARQAARAEAMAAASAEAGETSESAAAPRGALPEDFPGYDALVEAGYDTYGKVRAAGDEEILSLPGIGDARLAAIRDAAGGA